jgi:WD40 repeat protein
MSASRDGSVRFWDMLSGLNVKTLSDSAMLGTVGSLSSRPCCSYPRRVLAPGDVSSASLSDQGTLLLTMAKHGPLRLWDLRKLDRPLQRCEGGFPASTREPA